MIKSILILFGILFFFIFAQGQCYELKGRVAPRKFKIGSETWNVIIQRVKGLNSLSTNEHPIIINRILVQSAANSAPLVAEKSWNDALQRVNEIFNAIGLSFVYSPLVTMVYNKDFADFGEDDFELLDRAKRNTLSVFVVNEIYNDPSTNGLASGGIPRLSGGDLGDHLVLTYRGVGECGQEFTMAHEIGHLFGLFHTHSEFQGKELVNGKNSAFTGDLISDTYANSSLLYSEFVGNCEDSIPEGFIFTGKDCNGETYHPQINNLMSYFPVTGNPFSKQLTTGQTQTALITAHEFRGNLFNKVWVQVPIPELDDVSYQRFSLPQKVHLKSKSSLNVKSYKWNVIGGTIDGLDNEPEAIVNVSGFGPLVYWLEVWNGKNRTGEKYETPMQMLEVSDPEIIARKLPVQLNFENGLPPESTGWIINKFDFDCTPFRIESVGSRNQSKRSLGRTGIYLPQLAESKSDIIESPFIDCRQAKNISLAFDYSYSTWQNPGDTLFIVCETGLKMDTIWKRGGDELETSGIKRIGRVFVPSKEEWSTVSINLDSKVISSPDKIMKFLFHLTTQGGNAFYLDNIRIIGVATNQFELSFDHQQHVTKFQWTDFAPDEIGYHIQRTELGRENWQIIHTTKPNIISWSEVASNPILQYRYRILADGSANIFPSNEDTIDVILTPAKPKMLQTIVEGRSVGVKWTDPNEYETGYDLYYSYSKGATMALVRSLPADPPEYLHRKLPANTKVYYMVRARERNFVSEPSDTIEALVNVYNVQSRIDKVEGYFDEPDPGPGNGIALDKTGNSEEIIATGLLSVDQLSNGIHVLYLRARDNKGYWSNIQSSTFVKLTRPDGAPAITKLEYALNASGNVKWIPVDIGPGIVANEGLAVPIDAPVAALPDGIHFVTIRAQDNQGHWSNYFHQSFLKITGPAGEKKVITLEYKIDKGLIIGSGTTVSLTPGSYVNASIDLPPLPNGKHYISIATKDNGGYYSNIAMDSFVVRDQSFCEKNATVFYRSPINNARSYFWQVNDGSGWKTIVDNDLYTGSRTQVLRLNSPPTNWYGYQYRSIANGVIEEPFTLKFSDTWTGTENDDWHNPANWCCFGVPDEYTDVIIDPTTTRKPKISASSICRSLTLKPGALLKIEDGQTLEIKGQ